MHTVGYLLSHMLTQTPALEEASVSVVGSVTMLRQFTAVKGADFKGLCAWNSDDGRNPSGHSGTACCFHLARKTNNGVHIFQPSLVM